MPWHQKQPLRPLIVGVAGGSGSGKTTVADRILRILGEDRVTVIQHDSYYIDRSDISVDERVKLNYDHPDALDTPLLVTHLRQLLLGNNVSVPIYDFTNHVRLSDERTVTPRPVIVIDGILVLADRSLRELIDLKVYVDTDSDLRLIRRLERDLSTRQRSVESITRQYLDTVRPMHLEFVEPSKQFADILIPEGGYNELAVGALLERIETLLEKN